MLFQKEMEPTVSKKAKYLEKLTNSVDVLHMIDDLSAAGVKFAPNLKEGAETLYADDIDEAN